MTTDAFHVTAPHPDGEGHGARDARRARAGRRRAPTSVGYVNAHGTATPQNDRIEARAMREVFGEGGAPRQLDQVDDRPHDGGGRQRSRRSPPSWRSCTSCCRRPRASSDAGPRGHVRLRAAGRPRSRRRARDLQLVRLRRPERHPPLPARVSGGMAVRPPPPSRHARDGATRRRHHRRGRGQRRRRRPVGRAGRVARSTAAGPADVGPAAGRTRAGGDAERARRRRRSAAAVARVPAHDRRGATGGRRIGLRSQRRPQPRPRSGRRHRAGRLHLDDRLRRRLPGARAGRALAPAVPQHRDEHHGGDHRHRGRGA